MEPLITNCKYGETPNKTIPLLNTAMNNAPRKVPSKEPLPPNKLVPPTITAAITSNSQPFATVGVLDIKREVKMIPAKDVNNPVITKTAIFTLCTGIPES